MKNELHQHTISSHYVRGLLGGAQRRGLAAGPILAQAGIPLDVLDMAGSRVFPDQVARLVTVLWETLNDECMGLTTNPCRPGAFGLMANAAVHAKTMGEAFRQCTNYYRYFSSDIAMGSETNSERTLIWMASDHPASDPEGFFHEFLLLAWSRFANWLSARHLKPLAIEFTGNAPAHRDELDYLFGCPARFNASRNCLIYPADFNQIPVVRTAEELPHLLDNLALAILQKPATHGLYTRRIRRVLLETAMERWPDLPELAERLHVSERTLRRKLTEEESSVQHIKDQLRRDKAIYLLRQQKLSVNDIAFATGFTEASAFIRAFKLWTGVSPGHYQRDSIRGDGH